MKTRRRERPQDFFLLRSALPDADNPSAGSKQRSFACDPRHDFMRLRRCFKRPSIRRADLPEHRQVDEVLEDAVD